jgi:hypothetical protein
LEDGGHALGKRVLIKGQTHFRKVEDCVREVADEEKSWDHIQHSKKNTNIKKTA